MSGYVLQWYDHELAVADSDTRDSITRAEFERLTQMYAIAVRVQSHPRRLGTATPEELALDKLRAKRVGHVAAQLLKAWEVPVNSNGAVTDISQKAAQMEWKRWWQEHETWLLNRRRYIATWCQKTGSDPRWCKQVLTRINNELSLLSYAMRD